MIYALFGGRTSQTRMVKNAAHWATNDEGCKVSISSRFQKIREFEPIAADHIDTSTRIDSAVRKFNCLNDIFAELIEDNAAIGMTA